MLRIAEAVLATGALAVSLVGIPGTPAPNLDASWQLMLIQAHERGLQFGRDIIFTWGPWGFLCCGYHKGASAAVPILIWQTLGQLAVALGLVGLTRFLPLARRVAFVVLLLAFHWLFLDTAYFVLIALCVVSGMLRRESQAWTAFLCAAALGFLAELKFTYCALAVAGVMLAAAVEVLRGRRLRAACLAAVHLAVLLGSWVAAGQELGGLYPYLRRGVDIATGYGAAMGLDEPWGVFLLGAGALAAVAVFLATAARGHADRLGVRAAVAFLALVFFAMWKEAFTRADMVGLGGHVFGLFCLVLVLAPVLPGLLAPGGRLSWLDALVPLILWGLWAVDPNLYRTGPQILWERWYGNTHALADLASLPGRWQLQYEEACADAALPAVKAAVGARTVDVYDYSLAAALMNGLNVDNRPVMQGYTAYTPSLEGWNLRHYQSARAPDFLLWSEERIDNRFPNEDDAMLVPELAGHFEPVLAEGPYLLLRRTSALAPGPQRRTGLLTRSVRLGEEINVPQAPSVALGMEVRAVPTGVGRLRTLLYKDPSLFLTTTDQDGRRQTWRFLPRVARAGMLLSPVLTHNGDAEAFLQGRAPNRVVSLHFDAPTGQEEFWLRFDVAIYSLDAIALRPADAR